MLMAQAGADTVVGQDQTETLAETGSATLYTVAGADHLFTKRDHSDELVLTILNWLSDTKPESNNTYCSKQ